MKMGDVRQENYTIKGFLPSRRKGPAAAGSRCFFRPDGGRAMLRHGKKRRRGIEFYKALWWNKVQSPKVFSVPFGYGAGRREKAWRRSQRKVPPVQGQGKVIDFRRRNQTHEEKVNGKHPDRRHDLDHAACFGACGQRGHRACGGCRDGPPTTMFSWTIRTARQRHPAIS